MLTFRQYLALVLESNNRGAPGAKYDLHQNMRAYDRLPKKVRNALANADHNWSAGQALYVAKRKKKMSDDELTNLIKSNDAKMNSQKG